MFEKMMECKKSWKLFCEWIFENYQIDINAYYNVFYLINAYEDASVEINKNIILSIMPIFFDEHEINEYVDQDINGIYYKMFYGQIGYYDSSNDDIYFSDRTEALQAACIKAFELLEETL